MKRFRDPEDPIRVTPGEHFAVELPGNPTTGYTWHCEVAAGGLQPMGHEFKPEGTGLGGGGQEVFRFAAPSAGTFEIAFTYRRPWGGPDRDARRIRVVVGDVAA